MRSQYFPESLRQRFWWARCLVVFLVVVAPPLEVVVEPQLEELEVVLQEGALQVLQQHPGEQVQVVQPRQAPEMLQQVVLLEQQVRLVLRAQLVESL